MTFWALAFEPERSTMFAEVSWRSWIDTLGEVHRFRVFLGTQGGQHPLRRKRRFVQADSDGVVDGVRNGRNGRGKRSFTAFLGAEGALGIDALNDDGFDLWRFDR